MIRFVAAVCTLIGLATGLGCLTPALAMAQEERPTIVITPGKERAFRAAVQRFADRAAPANPRRADDLRAGIEAGLEFNAVLRPIAHEAFLGDDRTKELLGTRRYDCADWTQSGADALVEGEIGSQGGQLSIDFAVWDTARCKRLTRATLSAPSSKGPQLAREVADQIVAAMTGTRGVAATELAFVSNRTGRREIYVMNADGSDARAATRSAAIKAFPDWLPKGEGLLYTSHTDGRLPGLHITARTSSVRAGPILRSLLPGAPKYRGVLNPAGDTLALVSSVGGASEIYLVSRTGRQLRRLIKSPAIEVGPSWSPDGKQIVFVSDRTGGPQLYIVDREGENLRRLTYEGSYNTAPSWSPDGRWIAYEARLDGQLDIWLIDPSGEVNFPLAQHPRSDESPSWSPDGRKVVFSSKRRGRADLYAIGIGGDDLIRLTQGAGDNTSPAWAPFPR